MRGTIGVWIWIIGGVIAGLLILTIANSYLTQTTRTIAEQRAIEQHDELRTQINELCWSSSENKKQYSVNLNENVLGIYLTKDKYEEYNEIQLIDFILEEEVSSGNLLCMKLRDKRLMCEQLDCNSRMVFLGAVPTESSLSALIDNIIGNPNSFEYKLNFSKFDKEVLVSLAGGKEVLPVCNLDGICDITECLDDCNDCHGPNPICIGDNFCNPDIGEDCLTSIDCVCNVSGGYACCLEDPASDRSGCVDETRQNLQKGETCFCDNECDITVNLICNYIVGDMNAKACCEPGYSWNGSECIIPFCTYPCTPGCILPDDFDWRNHLGQNWMTPIRAQGVCGSCYAFSAVGCVEGIYKVEQDNSALNPDLSEEYIVTDCIYPRGCNGGWHYAVLGSIRSSGIVDENCLPYVSGSTCRISCAGCSNPAACSNARCSDRCTDWSSRLGFIGSYSNVPTNTDSIKRALICQGPLSMALNSLNHAVGLVGYDGAANQWIIRNSWGLVNGVRNGIPHTNGYGYVPYNDIRMVYYVENVNLP